MSTTPTQPVPAIRRRQPESRIPSPSPSVSASPTLPNAIPLTNIRRGSQESVRSVSTAQATPTATPAPSQPSHGNRQAAAAPTWYRRTWLLVRQIFVRCFATCGLVQLLVGLASLGLAIPVLKLSIYLYQLSQWTAWKDFRQDCRSLNVSASYEVHLQNANSCRLPYNFSAKSVRLPFLDPSQYHHMSLWFHSKNEGCWRARASRNSTPHQRKLLSQLLCLLPQQSPWF